MTIKATTVGQFRDDLDAMAAARMGLTQYRDFLDHRTRDDKRLREELLPILAVVRWLDLQDDEVIELGGETEDFDARIRGEPYEVVQALPEDEHEVRRSLCKGQSPYIYLKHSADHLQFPEVVIDAIDRKHEMHYSDKRHLAIAFDGDYSEEDDRVIDSWIAKVREKSHLGRFRSILLVERARLKVFSVL